MKWSAKLARLLRDGFVLMYSNQEFMLVNAFHRYQHISLEVLVDSSYSEEYRS